MNDRLRAGADVLKPLLFRGGVWGGGARQRARRPCTTPLRLGREAPKSRCPSSEEEGLVERPLTTPMPPLSTIRRRILELAEPRIVVRDADRKSTRLNSSH